MKDIDSTPRGEALRLAAVVALAAAMCGIVLWTLVARGPFAWHFSQAEAWQGALEALLLLATTVAALHAARLGNAGRIALFAIPVLLYLRRHHVDGALLVALAYAEGLFALGALALRAMRGEEETAGRWLRQFLLGVALFSLLLWLAQMAGFGTPRVQRLLALLVLLPALVWHRRLQSAALLRAAWHVQGFAAACWSAALIVLPLVLFARTNTAVDFDSLWYGLRPERVLVGAHSVFEPLGFASPVYYFPKLYEVLTLPLAATREDSVVQGFAVLCGGLLARLSFDFMRRLGVERVLALAGSVAIWTTPAVTGAALGAKPDMLVALLIVAMAWFTFDLREGRRARFAWIFGCAALASSSKLLAIPYAGAAGIAALIVLRRAPRNASDAAAPWFLALALLVAAACAARTLAVAGVPTIGPEPLIALWNAMGLRTTAPVGTLEWLYPQDWAGVPMLLVGWLFEPSRFSHLQVSWPGNLFVFLPLAALLFGPARRAASNAWPLWAVPAAGLALLLGVRFTNVGGDGNYFIAPLALACIGGLAWVDRRIDTPHRIRALSLSLCLFVAFQFYYGFASIAWSVGTRTWDADFARANRDSPERHAGKLAELELEGVARVLHGAGGRLRVSGVAPYEAGFRLPARYEDLVDVVISHYGDPPPRDLLRLSACGGVEAMLVPRVVKDSGFSDVGAALARLRSLPESRDLLSDERWRLIDVRGALPPCPAAAP